MDDDAAALDSVLARLGHKVPQAAAVVNLRYFAGLTIEQTAATLGNRDGLDDPGSAGFGRAKLGLSRERICRLGRILAAA